MKYKKNYLILSIILIVLSTINIGIVLVTGLFGSLLCDKPFYIVSGSNGPIPTCDSIFNTSFTWIILLGIILLIIGIICVILFKKR